MMDVIEKYFTYSKADVDKDECNYDWGVGHADAGRLKKMHSN